MQLKRQWRRGGASGGFIGVRRFAGALALLIAACGTAVVLGARPGEAATGACTQTTSAAYDACRHEARESFWIATGNCLNVSRVGARARCLRRAQRALDDERGLCGQQSLARRRVCQALGEGPYDPKIDPAQFVDPALIGATVAPNRYFPLLRGRTWVYQGEEERIEVTVTRDVTKILGVRCAVVRDVVKVKGTVVEDTLDWYAQDRRGNVWYFGEISQTFRRGVLTSIAGSWTAGVDGAKPGIIMKAAPRRGKVYRQEFSLGNAEDMGKVLSLKGSLRAPAASCRGRCLVTKDYSPLEPDAVEYKYFAPGVGQILAVDPETHERIEWLVEVRDEP